MPHNLLYLVQQTAQKVPLTKHIRAYQASIMMWLYGINGCRKVSLISITLSTHVECNSSNTNFRFTGLGRSHGCISSRSSVHFGNGIYKCILLARK
jgi:hypothetical protein